jgi:hypothetical protein
VHFSRSVIRPFVIGCFLPGLRAQVEEGHPRDMFGGHESEAPLPLNPSPSEGSG